jgi:hypothetical protein
MTYTSFWHALESLHRWEREHLPGADTPQGNEVLVWLLKSKNRPRPLKDLYRSSRFSEPTVRSSLKVFVSHGFVIIESNGEDMRTRFARGTLKLEKTVNEYRRRFHEVASLAHTEGLPAPAAPHAAHTITDLADAVPTKPQ